MGTAVREIVVGITAGLLLAGIVISVAIGLSVLTVTWLAHRI